MKKLRLQGKYSDRFALVDNDMYEKLHNLNWLGKQSSSTAYALTKIQGSNFYLHRLIMNDPKGLEVDHINGNGLDNRKENLRVCTRKQNAQNKTVKKPNASSIYIGVTWSKIRNGWLATVILNSKVKNLGVFKEERHAAMARDIWAKDIYGEFAKLNFATVEPININQPLW